MQTVAIIASVAATSLASSGLMSVYKINGGYNHDGIGYSKCKYAAKINGGEAKSPAATSPHIQSYRYCGVSAKVFAGGASCGACYNVSYSGEGGTNQSKYNPTPRAGSAVVQVVDDESKDDDSDDFSCHWRVFKTITGGSGEAWQVTGTFPITYTEVACEVQSAVGVATVLDGYNAYYTQVIFSDLPHAVSSAKLKIGKKSFPMDRTAGGATFTANTDGSVGSASFELTLADGSTNKLASCFESWPVSTGSSCTPKAVVESKHCDDKRTYAQCGGYTYKGETCCPKGRGCSFVSAEYSQCSGCAASFGQCGGGPSYNGSTCCSTGFECQAQGTYYSGCVKTNEVNATDGHEVSSSVDIMV